MYKHNNGNGAGLCDQCHVIVKFNAKPSKRKLICSDCKILGKHPKKHQFNRNYYRLNLKAYCDTYTRTGLKGNKVTYVNDFSLLGREMPYAVFKATKPNKALGHKNYFGIVQLNGAMYITGWDKKDLLPYSKVNGIRCAGCKSVRYSPGRHANVDCDCGNVSIDGGDAYSRISTANMTGFDHVTIDLFANKVIDVRVKSKKRKKK